ncbi:hypothetical protein J2Z76_002454 [Sedimentibacter acidaminivorans]|uniref:Uncharacterized protein n=1 Tax=Sedimentibacter acidaminivorans TaxID=913099 RepID=A0ABS4GFW3_9FIRM|nr:hypothetical protein [Sedimentibacter acidaminivorans]
MNILRINTRNADDMWRDMFNKIKVIINILRGI